jgi:hypothetical protein
MTQNKTEIEILYDIIYDYLENSNIQLAELIFIFEQIKFEQMQEAMKKLNENNTDSTDGN